MSALAVSATAAAEHLTAGGLWTSYGVAGSSLAQAGRGLQLVAAETRCVAKNKPSLGEDDLFDLVSVDQQQLAPQEARSNLE